MTALETPARPAGTDDRVAEAGAKVPMLRLIAVELRKLADTRAGLWLLIVIALASVATAAILLLAAPAEEQTFAGFFGFAQLPAGVLLPVLGILSMTGEWSQRTALTTFALTPQRGRVFGSKLAAAVIIAVLAAASTYVFAAAANLIAIAADGNGSWALPWQVLLQCLALQVLYVLMGSAFGALLMNTPLAIVGFFALPMVWTILGEAIRSLRTATSWLDINTTTAPLTEAAMTGGQWARLGVSCAVWILVPLVAGAVRVLKREVS
ncbi:ABC transporter permease [Actinoplanes sp. NPDC051633]|uniref:ABC transporter permease n=1 Tax=Actinoplanes sp. NPDC051633 TaxID=3155670 RepID=UPI0034401CC8